MPANGPPERAHAKERENPKLPAEPAAPAPSAVDALGAGNLVVARLLRTGGELDDVTDVADRIRARAGTGEPLPANVHSGLETGFGRPLGDIRIHRDDEAASLSTRLGARAFTTGQDIFFGQAAYDPGSASGYRLLAHEVAHTVQQGAGSVAAHQVSDGLAVSHPADPDERAANAVAEQVVAHRSAATPATGALLGLQRCAGNAAIARFAVQIQREVDDPTIMTITDATAQSYSDEQLQANLRRVEGVIADPGTDSEARTAQEGNARILRAEVAKRGLPVAGAEMPRPAGLPLDQGFQLIPLDVPADVATHVPDGQILELGGAAAQPESGQIDWDFGLETGAAATGGAILAGNIQVSTYGFAAAGESAVGLVAIPRTQGPFGRGGWNPAAGLNPNANPVIDLARPLDSWGHTAMYVRQNGRITWVRGFGPDMGLGQLPGFARAASGVESGAAAWPGVVESDTSMLRSTMARTIEYPIEPAMANRIAGMHPEGPGGTGGSPTHYTARPGVYAEGHRGPAVMCANQNCVMYAVEQVESHLGGPVGRAGQGSIVNQGGTGTASQGRLYQLMTEAEAGTTTLASPPGATGPAVTARMPAGLRYLKWGGRVFLVVGIVAGGHEIATAAPEQRARTAVGVGGGFAGGFALGATAGLVCGPGAPVCSIVAGLGLGIVGAIAGRSLAEYVYDAIAPPPAGKPLTERERSFAEEHGVVCPSCHSRLERAERTHAFDSATLLGTALATASGGASSGREHELTLAEQKMIMDFLGVE